MKKYLAAGAAIAVLLAMSAHPGAAADKKYVFALVPKNMNNPFFDQARDGCKQAEKELAGAIECLYIGPGEHGGGEEQVQVVNDLIARRVDGIAVSPSNAPAMGRALIEAQKAGIPVLTWDSDLLERDKKLRIARSASSRAVPRRRITTSACRDCATRCPASQAMRRPASG
jgi:ribose transport system substrate-binding protein